MPKGRKPPRRVPLKTLRIYCEGAKTEPAYINSYLADKGRGSRTAVIEVEKTSKTTAVQLVKEAIAAKNSPASLPGDEFWVVYDRESTAKYSDALHASAFDEAARSNIEVAITNVCFEYWLLLHFIATTAPYASFDDLWKNSPFANAYRAASGRDYEKSASSVFQHVKAGIGVARTRAARLNAAAVTNATPGREQPFRTNPYVGMVKLLDAIDAFK